LLLEWFTYSRRQTRWPFHAPLAFRLDGEVRASVLERAFNEVIVRHDALRSAFPDISKLSRADEQRLLAAVACRNVFASPLFYLDVHPNACLAINMCDRSGASVSEVLTSADTEDDLARPFDYQQPPLLRVSLVRLSDRQHLLLIVFHHLIIDGWSVLVFMKELASHYRALLESRDLPPASEALVSAECGARERARLMNPEMAPLIEQVKSEWARYWHAQLTYRDLPFPVDDHRDASAGNVELECESDLSEAIRHFYRQRRVTTYVLVLAAVYVVGYAYRGHRDVAVWGISSNRTGKAGDAIGWFASDRLLGMTVAPHKSGAEWVDDVNQLLMSARARSHVPRSLVHYASNQERAGDNGRIQLSLDASFSALEKPLPFSPELTANWVDVPGSVLRRAVRLSVAESAAGIWLRCGYSRDACSAQGASRILEDLRQVIASVVRDPRRSVSSIASDVVR